MKKAKIYIKFLILTILCIVCITCMISIQQPGYLIVRLDTNYLVLKDGSIHNKIKSYDISPLMVSYLTFDAMDQGVIKEEDYLFVSNEASKKQRTNIELASGSRITVNSLIQGILFEKDFGVQHIIAENLAGGKEQGLIKLMNRVGQDIGLKETVFRDFDKSNITTVEDKALLILAIKNHFPKYWKKYFETPQNKYILNGVSKSIDSNNISEGIEEVVFIEKVDNVDLLGVYFKNTNLINRTLYKMQFKDLYSKNATICFVENALRGTLDEEHNCKFLECNEYYYYDEKSNECLVKRDIIISKMTDNCLKAYDSMGDVGKELQRNGVNLHECCQHKMRERLSVMTNKEMQNVVNDIKTKGYEELDITVVPSKYTQRLCQEEIIWYMLGYRASEKPVRINKSGRKQPLQAKS